MSRIKYRHEYYRHHLTSFCKTWYTSCRLSPRLSPLRALCYQHRQHGGRSKIRVTPSAFDAGSSNVVWRYYSKSTQPSWISGGENEYNDMVIPRGNVSRRCPVRIWAEHRPSRLRTFVVFHSPSRQMFREYLGQDTTASFHDTSNSSSYPTTWR
jgi:hypothetical protein